MAAEEEGRTEEPSEFKLEKARKEGRVAKSQDISQSLVLLFTIIVLVIAGKWIFGQCMAIYKYYFNRVANPDVRDANLYSAFLNFFIKIILPTSLVGIVAGVMGNIIQTKGIIFSLKPIEPKFSKILPKFGEYFRKTLFSMQGFWNVSKSLLKVTLIGFITFLLVRSRIWQMVDIIDNGNINLALGKISSTAATLIIIIAVLFLVISIPDYFVQKHQFIESMKMTKQEQKEEYKEMEGDPQVKARLKQMQKELLAQNIPKAVAEADVVITNPTHFAVALKYEQNASEAPVVTAKGEDQIALTMRRLANENKTPIVEDRPLARALYNDFEVGQMIDERYYKTVSIIYSQILKSKV